MLFFLLFLLISLGPGCNLADDSSASNLGDDLVLKLRNDKNLDLSEDPEYQDLRSEFLAYRSVLHSLGNKKRSMISTPCANMGGICINENLCPGHRHLTEVPGCGNQLQVCCLVRNIYNVRDQSEHGIGNSKSPLRSEQHQYQFSNNGIKRKRHKKRKKKWRQRQNERNINWICQRNTVCPDTDVEICSRIIRKG